MRSKGIRRDFKIAASTFVWLLRQKKWVVTTGILIPAMILFLFGCGPNGTSYNEKNNHINLNKNEILQISISTFPPIFKAFDITDKEQISIVADYLTSLTTMHTKLNPYAYAGGGHTLKIKFENGTERVLLLNGNKFFIEKGKFTYEIPYNEAIQFDIIVANILQSNQIKNGEPSIVGTVTSIEAEESGRDISCVINDEGNATHNVYVKNADIINGTGDGWIILHKNDVIKVFCQKGTPIDTSPIIATTVYIQKTAPQLKE